MKAYKESILNRLNELCEEFHSVMVRRAALECGINHLKTQETQEIINAFLKTHPQHKVFKLQLQQDEPQVQLSLFSRAFVTDNESIPEEARELLKKA